MQRWPTIERMSADRKDGEEMRIPQRSVHSLDCLAQVFGQSALWLGGMVALTWTVGFAVLARHVGFYEATAPGLSLPIEPPLIGLALGTLALLLARLANRRVSPSALIGLVLSAEALALAIAAGMGGS